MPRKNKDEYNEYMRNYMKNRSTAKRSAADDQAEQPDQFDPLQGTQPMPNELLKLGKDFVDKQAAKGDKGMDVISKVLEYAPTVVGLIQQFAKGMADSQAANQQAAPQYIPQPPPFYGTPKAVQFLDDPAWIRQRDEWLAYRAGRPITQAPQAMAAHYQYEQRQVQQRGLPPQQGSQPRSMAELNAAAESDMRSLPPVKEDGMQGLSSEERPKETSGEQAMRDAENRRRAAAGEPPLDEPAEQEGTDMEQVINEMREDNKRAVQFVVQWINGQTDDQLLKYLEKDEPFKQYYPMLGFLPVQYRDMIVTLSAADVWTVLEQGCPEKIKLVTQKGKKDKLLKAWSQLQDRLKG